MAFFEERFDERISFGARGGPAFSTTRAQSFSGRRSANRNWLYPLHRYSIGHAIKTNSDFEVVRSFFYVVYGAFDGFRFKDWSDFRLTQNNSTLSAKAGSPAEYQVYRVYALGTRTFLRPIYKLVDSVGLIVYRTRAGVVSVASASVDYNAGSVQIVGHLAGDTYTCAGEFDVPVAFVEDVMEHEIVDRGTDDVLVRWPSVTLEEIRVEL